MASNCSPTALKTWLTSSCKRRETRDNTASCSFIAAKSICAKAGSDALATRLSFVGGLPLIMHDFRHERNKKQLFYVDLSAVSRDSDRRNRLLLGPREAQEAKIGAPVDAQHRLDQYTAANLGLRPRRRGH